MKRSAKTQTLSVPPEIWADFERLADEEGRNQSDLLREMLRVYRIWREFQEFKSLQRYGAEQAQRLGVKDIDDVDRLIQEFRNA